MDSLFEGVSLDRKGHRMMVIAQNVMGWLFRLPPIRNPDETRRRAILARISIFLAIIALLLLLDALRWHSFFEYILNDLSDASWNRNGLRELFLSGFSGLLSLLSVWGLNRIQLGRLGWLPGMIMLSCVTVLVACADFPQEVIEGRSLMLWVIPIALAPLILPSWTAFVASSASAAAMIVIATRHGLWINLYAVLGLYAIAFVSWLSARALEDALRAERSEAEKNRVILEKIADGVVVIDESGQVQVANPAARNILGADWKPRFPFTESQLEKDGRIVAFSWTQIDGVGRAAVLRDITRQVEIERAKDALLGTVSHELRTPLAAIGGFAELIALLSQNEKISDMAGRIVSNVARLKGLVNSLLDQAQIQAGTLKLTCIPCSPAQVVREVHTLLGGLAAEKKLDFLLEYNTGLPESVLGDPERIHQVLVNLAGNAIKFTDQGTVTIRVFPVDDKRWGFSVSDTGDGIPAARLPDIFQPFRRGADYATRTRQGAGLGLSIAKQLVELMGGAIQVTSKPGQGTIFGVILPREFQP